MVHKLNLVALNASWETNVTYECIIKTFNFVYLLFTEKLLPVQFQISVIVKHQTNSVHM